MLPENTLKVFGLLVPVLPKKLVLGNVGNRLGVCVTVQVVELAVFPLVLLPVLEVWLLLRLPPVKLPWKFRLLPEP